MKKIIILILISFGLQSQTLTKAKQIGDGLSTGSVMVTGGPGGSMTYSAIASLPFTPSVITTAPKNTSYTLNVNEFVPVDLSANSSTLTFPNAPIDGAMCGIKIVTVAPTFSATIQLQGADVFNVLGGVNSGKLFLLNHSIIFKYKASVAIWYGFSSDLSLSQLDLRYVANPAVSQFTAPSIFISGTTNNGYIYFPRQVGTPVFSNTVTPAIEIYSDNSAFLSWVKQNSTDIFTRKFGGINTANRIYTLPDNTGTVALLSDLSAYTPTVAGGYLPVNNPAYTGTLTIGALTYTDTNVAASFEASVNGYYQFIVQNASNGNTASSDIIVSNDQGTSTNFYGNFGMNSSSFTGAPVFNKPNAIYVTGTGGDLILGTTSANAISLATNNSSIAAVNINSVGVVTIPTLAITGSVTSPSFVTNGGTSSQFVKGNGSLDNSIYLTSANTNTLYLPINNPTFTGIITGMNSSITNATITNQSGTNQSITNNTLTNVTSTNVVTTSLSATNGTLTNITNTNLTTNSIVASTETVSIITSTNVNTSNLTASNATIATITNTTINTNTLSAFTESVNTLIVNTTTTAPSVNNSLTGNSTDGITMYLSPQALSVTPYAFTISNGTKKITFLPANDASYGGGWFGMSTADPLLIGANFSGGNVPAISISPQTTGAIEAVIINPVAGTYTGTSSLRVNRGGGSNILELGVGTATNYFTMASSGACTYSSVPVTIINNTLTSTGVTATNLAVTNGTITTLTTNTLQVGSTANTSSLTNFILTKNTATLQIGEYSSGRAAIWGNTSAPSAANWWLSGDAVGNTFFNGTSSVRINVGANIVGTMDLNTTIFAPSFASSGAKTTFAVTAPNNTGQTASTEIPDFLFTSGMKTYGGASTLTLQRIFSITSPTVAFGNASIGTDYNTFGLAMPTASTNANLSNVAGIYIPSSSVVGTTGTVTNAYCINVTAPTGATNNYAAKLMGRVGINTAQPAYTLDVTGTTNVSSTLTANGITNTGNETVAGSSTVTGNQSLSHIIGTKAIASSSLSTGAGTGATSTVTGCTDLSGTFTVTTAGTPATSATFITITFGTAYTGANPPNITWSPVNAAAATLSGTSAIYLDRASTTNTSFTFKTNSVAPGVGTYIYSYHVDQ